MDEEKRSNQNYEIIESCTIGSTELVIGHNPNAPNPYVCWYCKGGSNYFWGYYTNELDDARQKLNERYQSECRRDICAASLSPQAALPLHPSDRHYKVQDTAPYRHFWHLHSFPEQP